MRMSTGMTVLILKEVSKWPVFKNVQLFFSVLS